MKCLICKGEPSVESENFWLRDEVISGFIGQRVYYGSKETGLRAQRAILEPGDNLLAMQQLAVTRCDLLSVSLPIEDREKTAIYNFPPHVAATYPILDGIIMARFEHQRSGVIVEFHLCQDKKWQLLANVRNITIDTHAFSHLKKARTFLKIPSQTKRAKVTFKNLLLAVQKCEEITDESLADGISKVTGEAVTKQAVVRWRTRNEVLLDYLRRLKATPSKPRRR